MGTGSDPKGLSPTPSSPPFKKSSKESCFSLTSSNLFSIPVVSIALEAEP